jgi:inorganic pyrophosphatase
MMIAPGALVLLSPLVAGFLFGPQAVAGLLAGIIVSGIQVAISASNTGGAWDNCKKEIEKRRQDMMKQAREDGVNPDKVAKQLKEMDEGDANYAKYSQWAEKLATIKDQKNAAVVGDTVGDPLKDTSGPAINILIKLSAITSLVFGNYIKQYNLSASLGAK